MLFARDFGTRLPLTSRGLEVCAGCRRLLNGTKSSLHQTLRVIDVLIFVTVDSVVRLTHFLSQQASQHNVETIASVAPRGYCPGFSIGLVGKTVARRKANESFISETLCHTPGLKDREEGQDLVEYALVIALVSFERSPA